jgi:hypothetical protein
MQSKIFNTNMKIFLDFRSMLAYFINRESNDFAGGNDNAERNGNRRRKRADSDGNLSGTVQLDRDADHDGPSYGQFFDELNLNPLYGKKQYNKMVWPNGYWTGNFSVEDLKRDPAGARSKK